MAQNKLLLIGVSSLAITITVLLSFSYQHTEVLDSDFATNPYGVTTEEFQYIENNVNNSTREILGVLSETEGNVLKTISILNKEN